MENKTIILYKKYGRQFQSIFAMPVHKFLHPIFGFDVIRFDEFLRVPDGTSTKHFIEKKYGNEAVKLIQELIRG
jgi:hypothetical protein